MPFKPNSQILKGYHNGTANDIQHPFLLKKSKAKNGKAPISVRITVNGERAEVSAQRETSILEWDPRAQMVIGRGQEAIDINNHLAVLKQSCWPAKLKLKTVMRKPLQKRSKQNTWERKDRAKENH